MSTSVIRKRLISHVEYHQMGDIGLLKPDEKVELINGEIYTMSPIGSRHRSIVLQLTTTFVPAFLGEFLISVQNSINLDQWNEPEPDVTILKNRADRYSGILLSPSDILTVIEVSGTSYDFDLRVKLPLYASAGIAFFWIVNINEDRIEVYSDPQASRYANQTIFYPGDTISLLSIEFEVSDLLVLEI